MLNEIRFDTEGGTPLDAMHKYEPISLREIFDSFRTSPRYDGTKNCKKMLKIFDILF